VQRAGITLAALAAAIAVLAVGVAAPQARDMPEATTAGAPVAHAAATCSDYPNQNAAEEAADTRDADGDGIYCEDLPCPCSTEAGGGGGGGGDDDAGRNPADCTKPRGVKRIVFSKTKYPSIRKHFRIALRNGWPRRLVLNRSGADARRDRLLEDIPTKDGYDRDEYPPAVGRGKGPGSSADATRAAGRPTSATCPARRTDRTAPCSATRSRPSATARDSGTCSGN
jgi:hypothetical protein